MTREESGKGEGRFRKRRGKNKKMTREESGNGKQRIRKW